MEFAIFHKRYFHAKGGSFSRVTSREDYDSQITLTDFEADLVVNHFGISNIHIGNVKSDVAKAAKPFLLFPSKELISLNLVFPKPNKSELRLYLSKKGHFRPRAEQVWFLYIDYSDNLVVGAMDEIEWNKLDQIDEFDEAYQEIIEEIESKQKKPQVDPKGRIEQIEVSGRIIYKRDPRIAILSFQEASYTCEIDKAHNTFLAEANRKPYVEAHHFIPMKFQPSFTIQLDSVENVVALCPNCHRGIHHGVIDHKRHLIERLIVNRGLSNTVEDFAQYYNCYQLSQ